MKGMALEEFALRFTQAVAHFMWIGVLLALVLLVIDRFLLRTAAARHGLHLAGVLLLTLALPVCFVVVDGSGPELRIVLPTGIVEQKMDSGPVTAAPAELGFGVEEPGLLIPAGVLGEIAEPVASPIPAADVGVRNLIDSLSYLRNKHTHEFYSKRSTANCPLSYQQSKGLDERRVGRRERGTNLPI